MKLKKLFLASNILLVIISVVSIYYDVYRVIWSAYLNDQHVPRLTLLQLMESLTYFGYFLVFYLFINLFIMLYNFYVEKNSN